MKNILKALCAVACLIIGLSVILPYFSVSAAGVTVSVNLLDGRLGIVVLIVAILGLLLAVLGQFLPTLILGGASLGLLFIENNTITSALVRQIEALGLSNTFTTAVGKGLGTMIQSLLQRNVGYYALLIGSIALIVFSLPGLAAQGKGKR